MFARVMYGDSNEMLINPNCYIRLIYEYIRIKADVPNEVEIDLCDNKGNLKKINEPPNYKSGLELLEVGETYYLVSIKIEKKGRVAPVPLIDSTTALYETLVKRFEATKLSIKNIKSSNNFTSSYGGRRSKQIDAVVITDLTRKKKKKKELKPTKSTTFPSFISNEEKLDFDGVCLTKDSFHEEVRDGVDVKRTKDSKSRGVLIPVRKKTWYFNPSGNSVKGKQSIDEGKPTQIKN